MSQPSLESQIAFSRHQFETGVAQTQMQYILEPKSVEEQIGRLRAIWPKLEPSKGINSLAGKPNEGFSETWLVGVYPEFFGSTNHLEVMKKEVFPVIADQLNQMFSDSVGEWNPIQLNMMGELANTRYQELKRIQTKDIYALPMQSGRLYSGHSIGAATKLLYENEFILDSLQVAIFNMVFEKRLSNSHDPWMFCSDNHVGPDISSHGPNNKTDYGNTAFVFSRIGSKSMLRFISSCYNQSLERFSVPTAFLPES